MHVAVTGASGHLGANLVRALLARGTRVRALIHGEERALEGLPIERVRGDVLAPPTLAPLVDGVDLVFHLAAWISIDGDHGGAVTRVNTLGPRHVVAAAADAGVRRVVHFSSVHAYDLERVVGVVDESSPPTLDPRRDPYDRSKALGERAALEAAAGRVEVVIVQPTGCVGPHDHQPSLFGESLLGVLRGTIPALPPGGFDWVDARDVAAGAIAAAEDGRHGERYLLGSERHTVRAIGAMAASLTGCRAPFGVPMAVARAAAPFAEAWSRVSGRRAHFTRSALRALEVFPHVSCDKARRELGYAPRPVEVSVRDACAWYEAQGWLPAGVAVAPAAEVAK